MGHDPPLDFLAGGGVSGALARSVDWAATPLGPPHAWPQSLKTTVSIILSSRHPMFLWWGPALIQIYNDAYLPSFGVGKHPAAMGQRGAECWREIWPIISPQIDDVLHRRRSSWNEDHLVPIFRNGRIEEVYWTYGYSPVLDEGGGVGGVLVVCTETTARVLAERRSRTMHALIERTTQASQMSHVLAGLTDVLRGAAADVPFALVYLDDPDTGELRLSGSCGVRRPEDADAWARAQLAFRGLPDDGTEGRSVAGPPVELLDAAAEAPLAVYLSPFTSSDIGHRGGCVVFGLSPRLPFDETYRNHLDQITTHIALARSRIAGLAMRSAADSERNNLLSQAPVATALLMGPRHVFRLANPLYCRMVGRHDLVGKAYFEAFPELVGSDLPKILDGVYGTGRSFSTEEYQIYLDRNGRGAPTEAYFKFNLEPLRDADGAVYGMMAIAVDISEQVKARHVLEHAHAERKKLLEDLEAANRAKDEFLAMLGHELRNPLSPIATALQLMRLKGDSKTAKEQQVIERQVEHLTRLVDDLLDVSKITRGKVELRKERVDIADVIDKAIEMASDLFEQRDHHLSISVPRGRLHVYGDPVRLAQVVANLLTNAARYTDRGGRIAVTADHEGDEAVIRVKDNGSGISADLLPRVFDLFVQGKRASDRAEGGLGLGLALVKNLVGLHGGRVAAVSEGRGTGTEMVVGLPLAEPARPEVAPERVAGDEPAPSARRVLIVDDNVDAADMLADVLRAAGHEVAVAYAPSGGLALAETFRPEVAVLDVGLPVMDGYELGARIRAGAAPDSIRLIALTGYGQRQDRLRSEAAGFDHHLVKPVDIEELARVVAGDAPAAG